MGLGATKRKSMEPLPGGAVLRKGHHSLLSHFQYSIAGAAAFFMKKKTPIRAYP